MEKNKNKKHILAIDLGGTSAKVGLFDNDKIMKRWKIPTEIGNVFPNIKKNLSGISWPDIKSIGLSIPGMIDIKTQKVVFAGNLGFKNFDIKKEFKKVFNKDVYPIHDTKSSHLGELWRGVAKGTQSSIMYTLGTGVGGSYIYEDKLIFGSSGMAGEFGHGGDFTVEYECTCGQKVCVEAQSSAVGLLKLVQEEYNEHIPLEDFSVLLNKGNKRALKVLEKSMKPLYVHMAILIGSLNPEMVIIGGGPSNIGQPLLDTIKKGVHKHQLDILTKNVKFKIASLKGDAGMYGAAYWAMNKGKL